MRFCSPSGSVHGFTHEEVLPRAAPPRFFPSSHTDKSFTCGEERWEMVRKRGRGKTNGFDTASWEIKRGTDPLIR